MTRTRTLPRLAALPVLAAGAVHFKLWLVDGYDSISVIGPLFLLNAIAALALALALAARPRAVLVQLAAAGYAASTLVFFAISVTTGLFGFKEVLLAPAQEAAGIAELVALALLLPPLTALAAGRNQHAPRAARWRNEPTRRHEQRRAA
jgi:hypothetical protein